MSMKETSVLEQAVALVVRSVEDFQQRFSSLSIDLSFFQSTDKTKEDMSLTCLQGHLGLLIEEIGEVSKAINHGDVESAVQELLDVLYITVGALYMMGDARVGKALPGIIEKNDSKTPETHVMHSFTGKLVRK